ncbi:MAG TPA: outer membrane beta-barrel protein [Thermoanaerobaculia bacterium]|nr:outer membrane beta-barrel protein [Thermoanaerobaculia bacterium]
MNLARRTILGLAGVLVAAAPAFAQDGSRYTRSYGSFGEFRLWLGGFRPDASSTYWNDKFRDFTGSANDFQNVIGGADFLYHFDQHNALMINGHFYSGNATQSYRNFLDQNNNRIRHDTKLDISAGELAYVLFPAGERAPVLPYIGAGIGIYGWRLRESGDFINFNDQPPSVFSSTLADSGTAFGYFFLAGIEVPLSRHFAIFGEGRYTKASATLSGDFAGFGKLDLSGGEVAAGFAWHL